MVSKSEAANLRVWDAAEVVKCCDSLSPQSPPIDVDLELVLEEAKAKLSATMITLEEYSMIEEKVKQDRLLRIQDSPKGQSLMGVCDHVFADL